MADHCLIVGLLPLKVHSSKCLKIFLTPRRPIRKATLRRPLRTAISIKNAIWKFQNCQHIFKNQVKTIKRIIWRKQKSENSSVPYWISKLRTIFKKNTSCRLKSLFLNFNLKYEIFQRFVISSGTRPWEPKKCLIGNCQSSCTGNRAPVSFYKIYEKKLFINLMYKTYWLPKPPTCMIEFPIAIDRCSYLGVFNFPTWLHWPSNFAAISRV